jgi:hypothetical protein
MDLLSDHRCSEQRSSSQKAAGHDVEHARSVVLEGSRRPLDSDVDPATVCFCAAISNLVATSTDLRRCRRGDEVRGKAGRWSGAS